MAEALPFRRSDQLIELGGDQALITRTYIAFTAGIVFAALMGCSFIYDFDQVQCKSTEDCTARGDGFESSQCVEQFCQDSCADDDACPVDFACSSKSCVSRWECLSNDEVSSSSRLNIMAMILSIQGTPMSDLEVKLCSNFDPQCESPSQRLRTDANGGLSFEIDPDFGGYLETNAEGFFSQLNFIPKQLRDGMILTPITLTPREIIAGLAGVVGAEPDPERGHIVLSVASCVGNAAGVRISAPRSDENSILYYVNDGFPTADLESTTKDGSGGFLNFRTGNATVTLTTTGNLELSQMSLTVRSDTLSVVHFQPVDLYENSNGE